MIREEWLSITMLRRSVLGLLVVLAMAPHAWAADPAINVGENGLALRGYDVVAYFADQKAVAGKEAITAQHAGVTYRFSSEANRKLFQASPAKYLPQFGGYCAMGVAMNKKLDVNPELWSVVDGKLYLNVHEDAKRVWASDLKGNIAKAEQAWQNIKGIQPSQL